MAKIDPKTSEKSIWREFALLVGVAPSVGSDLAAVTGAVALVVGLVTGLVVGVVGCVGGGGIAHSPLLQLKNGAVQPEQAAPSVYSQTPSILPPEAKSHTTLVPVPPQITKSKNAHPTKEVVDQII